MAIVSAEIDLSRGYATRAAIYRASKLPIRDRLGQYRAGMVDLYAAIVAGSRDPVMRITFEPSSS
jgi:hypothetical protein